ncbi:PREDICTED: probable membrane-associated kinase regulator 1 [Tarenaya hassleriana]|uniref:probable membrane-associated kinase regulator 1 n=1 Tax=Tarenaya hassleriana TaxID=28532 RepID=UPI00053C7B07|nr:PREDICTED: probable membrane-associated kinase regulator 1 [Tarenaya hassleriana]
MRRETRRPPSPPAKKQSQSSPPSPSSSSSEFEFSVSISPRKASTSLCPADELFYKGQLLPLQLSPRRSLVRTLCSSESYYSSSSSSAARDSTGSSSSTDSTASFPLLLHAPPHDGCDSSRPSSVTDDDFFKLPPKKNPKSSAFSLSRFSSVFKKDPKNATHSSSAAATTATAAPSPVKRMSSTAKEVIRKYLKKVKPLYEKLSHKQQQQQQQGLKLKTEMLSLKDIDFPRKKDSGVRGPAISAAVTGGLSMTFSGNLKYPRRGRCAASCPSSMRSSPSHSGVLSRSGFPVEESGGGRASGGGSSMSSMEELQSAIQGAIAHCKNSMLQKNKSMVSLEI